jgi:hypothetical protein
MSDLRETLRLLRGLQDLDRNLFRVRDELRRLPAERTKRRERLDAETERLDELNRRIHEIQARVKEIEDLTTSQRQRVRKLENQASESRGDTALLVAFQHEIRSLKRDISEAEEEGLGLVEEVDRLSEERDTRQSAIATLEEEFAEYSGNIEKEMAEAEVRRGELDAERSKRMGAALTPETRTMYEKLLEAREGEAMAELEGRVCQGCFVSVPSNTYVRLARCTELVPCPSCGRILYLAAMD